MDKCMSGVCKYWVSCHRYTITSQTKQSALCSEAATQIRLIDPHEAGFAFGINCRCQHFWKMLTNKVIGRWPKYLTCLLAWPYDYVMFSFFNESSFSLSLLLYLSLSLALSLLLSLSLLSTLVSLLFYSNLSFSFSLSCSVRPDPRSVMHRPRYLSIALHAVPCLYSEQVPPQKEKSFIRI